MVVIAPIKLTDWFPIHIYIHGLIAILGQLSHAKMLFNIYLHTWYANACTYEWPQTILINNHRFVYSTTDKDWNLFLCII